MRTKLDPYFLLALFALANAEHSREGSCDLRQRRSNTTDAQCNFIEHDRRLVCFHGVDDEWESGSGNVQALVLCDWRLETFDPRRNLRGFSSLKRLEIINGNLRKLSATFPSDSATIQDLAITGTKLEELPRRIFANLSNLKTVDLRNNSLAEIDAAALNISSLHRVYLSGNPMKCTEFANWILDQEKGSPGRKVADKDHLRCTAPYEGKPLVQIIEIIQTLKEECKKTVCDCELVYVVGEGGRHIQKQLMVFASVNCSYRGLTEMPDFLPGNTTTLHLSGNKIHDLKPLTTNPAYRGVIDLYLDDNLIESIVQLEGSSWLDRFRLLSLRGNRLDDLPAYALENVLHHNGNAVSLYLGNNPWRCDCLFTPSFQVLLIKYTNLVKDVNNVRCSLIDGDENSGKIIRDLTRTEICVSTDEDPLLHPLDVLNIILAFLIFLVIGKLLYDYWSFRKTGKLPWIVAKMP